ncbi:hypothetical protein ABZ826_26035 [Streptomyces sp. NPDC047515]|uniref:hypothetical protein n=1 Tax=Streptomyces sp. NPDC047515 TaxID=3155380 RepID=UPI0033D6D9C7
MLSHLGQAEAEAQQIREAAAQQAEQNRRAAVDKAEGIVRLARVRAREVRTESAAHAYGLAKTEAAECLAESEHTVALLKRRAQQRMASLVDRTLADIGQIGDSVVPAGERAGGRSRWQRDGSRG